MCTKKPVIAQKLDFYMYFNQKNIITALYVSFSTNYYGSGSGDTSNTRRPLHVFPSLHE